jgi:hypothetical protein
MTDSECVAYVFVLYVDGRQEAVGPVFFTLKGAKAWIRLYDVTNAGSEWRLVRRALCPGGTDIFLGQNAFSFIDFH